MVGYANDHKANTYHMYDPQTNTIHLTQDVQWAKWQQMDPAATLDIFQSNKMTKHTAPMGAVKEDKPPPTTTGLRDNDSSHLIPALINEVGRNDLILWLQLDLAIKAGRTPQLANDKIVLICPFNSNTQNSYGYG